MKSFTSSIILCGLIAFSINGLYAAEPNDQQSLVESTSIKRWYGEKEVILGKKIYMKFCASCHGKLAEGSTPDWQQQLADGSYPPPPLDDSAHAWHHSLKSLLNTVKHGGQPKMPGFDWDLTEEEQLATIAYFQNFWTDVLYEQWVRDGGLKDFDGHHH